MSDSEWVTIKEAALMLGIPASRLRNGLILGAVEQIRGHTGTAPGGEKRPTLYLRAEVEAIAEGFARRKDAAIKRRLGRYLEDAP